jgi:hypothetical protein
LLRLGSLHCSLQGFRLLLCFNSLPCSLQSCRLLLRLLLCFSSMQRSLENCCLLHLLLSQGGLLQLLPLFCQLSLFLLLLEVLLDRRCQHSGRRGRLGHSTCLLISRSNFHYQAVPCWLLLLALLRALSARVQQRRRRAHRCILLQALLLRLRRSKRRRGRLLQLLRLRLRLLLLLLLLRL